MMDEFDLPLGAADAPRPNTPEYTVSEISTALKRTVEDNYGHVRVRGEISRPKNPGSGHLYMSLKDDRAVLDAVCWRGTVSRLSVRPEDGMEVICTGRLTTYAGQSKYQLVIEQMELAGEGALLKLLEDRRRRLAAEGLFDDARKKPLPFLPGVIGVVTSPSGAVIRDILHRLADRFPRHVLLWPVAVQGPGAAEQVAAAIAGFNRLVPGGRVPRPDVLIVARGGGSLEDLMAFNEEVVVRAAADSVIPLISAVGHETDTTLIDYAADRRAPTPTAAAEMAVPVRAELQALIADRGGRLIGAMARSLAERRTRIDGLGRGLGDPMRLLEGAMQRLDHRAERLDRGIGVLLDRRRSRLGEAAARLTHPRQRLGEAARLVDQLGQRLANCGRAAFAARRERFALIGGRLSAAPLRRAINDRRQRLDGWAERLPVAYDRVLDRAAERLDVLSQRLENCSWENVLRRGYVAVLDADGAHVVERAADATPGRAVTLRFADGKRDAVIGGAAADSPARPDAEAPPDDERQARARRRPAPPAKAPEGQGTLF